MAETVWIAIAENTLDDYLVAAQMTAVKTVALKAGQTNPVTRITADVVARVRNKVASCEHNNISADVTTVPPELKWATCYLIIEELQVRLPGLKLTEEQKAQVERALKELDRVADCKEAISTPSEPIVPDVQSGPPAVVVQGDPRVRFVTRRTMQGL